MGLEAEGAWGAKGLLVALLVAGAAQAATPEDGGGGPAAPAGEASSTGDAARAEGTPAPGKAASGGAAPAGGACAGGQACAGEEEAEPKLKLRLNGRVFARASADERDEYSRNVSIPSARVGVEAEWGLVSAEVSAEFTSSKLLRDAYVRVHDGSESLRLTAGQFKSPFMARALESAWDLPLLGRGLVEDYLVDTHRLGGRRPGLMLEARNDGWARLRTSLGVFRGARDELGQARGEDLAARATVRPLKGVDVGASAYAADMLGVAGPERSWAGGGDVSARYRGLSLSAEVLTGRIPVGSFTSQAALAWLEVPLAGSALWRLQPVAGAEALQLRGEGGAAAGQGWSVLGGVNALYGERFKVLLQVERALRPGDAGPGTAVGLQLAARFK